MGGEQFRIMIKLFRNIRKNLLNEGKTTRYFKYAIGEIILVVIGILIALQINNWNEGRKDNKQMLTNIHSIEEDIESDLLDFQNINALYNKQIKAGSYIIPIMESKNTQIADSLKFILDFNEMSSTRTIIKSNDTWNFLNASGIISEFPDSKLKKMLQDYNRDYNQLVEGLNVSTNPSRIELRKLKYELFSDTEHRKFFPTNTPIPPNRASYASILNDKRVLPLCKYIRSNATYNEVRVQILIQKATDILNYINNSYN